MNVTTVLDLDSPMEQREEDIDSPSCPAVERLLVFSCELSRGCSVSSMAWNKKNLVTQTHLLRSDNKQPAVLCIPVTIILSSVSVVFFITSVCVVGWPFNRLY